MLRTTEGGQSPTKTSLTQFTRSCTTRACFTITVTSETISNTTIKPGWTSRRTSRQRSGSTRGSRNCQLMRGGYHGVNDMKDMDGTHNAIINLAMAAAEDRETVMTQCKTIADLTKTLAALTQQLQQATTGNNRGPGLPVDRRSQANSKWVNGKYLQDVGGY